ncbi:DNA-directed RNA polymerase subunit beta [Ureibacillus thermophilus]|uniref:DNA-directed RNA polymerase subunit beta n=1 Tax=Ureibacillus thermophilus TaxID=367743 RepID=A0A4P6UT33_9BACL|nr:DNA-directed RNA polymerase subunit beta [Ureibacillus thermophilus]QBK25271.1 DNA-directed RNA polymerase subunit beta [Ureibacillus thermophilus]
MANELKSGSTLPQKRSRRRENEKQKRFKWMNDIHKKESPQNNDKESRNFKIYRTRKIPIWLRIVIVLILMFFASICGLMIGYGVIGEGAPMDALKWETYQHILDLINGKE